MKFLISLVVVVSLIAVGIPVLKVNAQPNISNDPSSHPFGVLNAGSTAETSLTHFTVTNSGNDTVNITISGTDMIGGVDWILADDANPGEDIYGLKAGLVSYDIIVKKTGPFNPLVSGLEASQTQDWGLKIFAPTSFTDGVAKEGTVTLTATEA